MITDQPRDGSMLQSSITEPSPDLSPDLFLINFKSGDLYYGSLCYLLYDFFITFIELFC